MHRQQALRHAPDTPNLAHDAWARGLHIQSRNAGRGCRRPAGGPNRPHATVHANTSGEFYRRHVARPLPWDRDRHAPVDRLEASSAQAAILLVRALDAGAPGSGAEYLPFGRGALIASGAGRYVNRAVGIRLDSEWAPSGTLATLAGRGYGPARFRAMLVHEVGPQRASRTLRLATHRRTRRPLPRSAPRHRRLLGRCGSGTTLDPRRGHTRLSPLRCGSTNARTIQPAALIHQPGQARCRRRPRGRRRRRRSAGRR